MSGAIVRITKRMTHCGVWAIGNLTRAITSKRVSSSFIPPPLMPETRSGTAFASARSHSRGQS
eukprot:CAMPEP_0119508268 /NCGR_PEP_ID=MMETSP1344-20130328/27928_1 /TAXON_ID=236787 /ORGANISM="Florenciella parvula, Strain CCMP2471" /LENGTH=62 /DNA_ID=CAMNT_0007544995 /DNA_START=412 /DNA_END=597 /DNA_ORIENTATION=+